MNEQILNQLVDKCHTAQGGGFGVLSSGEKLAVALVLDKPEWLAEMDYTLAQAIERVGPEWLACIPDAAAILANETKGI